MLLCGPRRRRWKNGSPDQLGLKRGTEKPDLGASVLWPPRRIVAAQSAKTGRETLAWELVHFCAMVTFLYLNGTTCKEVLQCCACPHEQARPANPARLTGL
jgi:hypothetical protein